MSEAQSRVEEMEEEIEEAEKKNRLHMSELSAVKLELAGSQTKCDKNRLRVGELERQITDLQASLDRYGLSVRVIVSLCSASFAFVRFNFPCFT